MSGRWRKGGLGSIFPVSTDQAAGDKTRSPYALLRVMDRTVMGDGGNFGRGGKAEGMGSFIESRSNCGAVKAAVKTLVLAKELYRK
jgi:hypothetical protein